MRSIFLLLCFPQWDEGVAERQSIHNWKGKCNGNREHLENHSIFILHEFCFKMCLTIYKCRKKRTNKQGMLHDAWKYFYLTISRAIWTVARNFHRWIRKAKLFLVRCVFCFGVMLRRNMILIFWSSFLSHLALSLLLLNLVEFTVRWKYYISTFYREERTKKYLINIQTTNLHDNILDTMV